MEKNKFYNYDLVLENAKEKLKSFRKNNEGYPDVIYAFSELLSEVVPDTVSVSDLGDIIDELDTILYVCTSHNPDDDIRKFSEVEQQIAKKVMATSAYKEFEQANKYPYPRNANYSFGIPTIINRIADKDFADNFYDYYSRYYCYSTDLREAGQATLPTQSVANWLVDNIGHPNSAIMLTDYFNKPDAKKRISDEQAEAFKEAFYSQIDPMISRGEKVMLDSNFRPSKLLLDIGSKIGLNGMFDYPIKTKITIGQDYAEVLSTFDGSRKVLFEMSQDDLNRYDKDDTDKQLLKRMI